MKHPIVLFMLCAVAQSSAEILNVSSQELQRIAQQIWQNESGKSYEKLIWWNEGEDFASVGICHFIWYPKNKKSQFQETFPAFLHYAINQGIKIPAFLKQYDYACPWNNREEFLQQQKSHLAHELRECLATTFDIQIRFMAQQLDNMLQRMYDSQQQKSIRFVHLLQQTPGGLYCLLDYFNFKGSGLNENERYKGQGWGLIQVLETIDEQEFEKKPCLAFSHAAKRVIEQRVKNSPPERNEQRWLKGWKNRIKTYGAFSKTHS